MLTAARCAIRTLSWALFAWFILLTKVGPADEIELFLQFDLPDDWEERYWADPDVHSLLELEPEELAKLVPEQNGFRFCRCPSCDAGESDDPLNWSIQEPERLTCTRCGTTFPNDEIPAKEKDAVPEETIEVLPGIVHRYPYHTVDPLHQRYPEERIYLDAKRDFEVRKFLSKAALYAAVRYREQADDAKDPKLARLSATLLVRFAQVYPAYATHYDQPDQSKYLQPANLQPPYRINYQTGKWDWLGCLEVPMNLLMAYAILRDDPALDEAGDLLDDPRPRTTIENDLFRAAAEFVLGHPDPYNDRSIYAARGIWAIGWLLDDESLAREAKTRLDRISEKSFYHDGLWRDGNPQNHRRMLALIDGWFAELFAADEAGHRVPIGAEGSIPAPLARVAPTALRAGQDAAAMLHLARAADHVALSEPLDPQIQRAAWPTPMPTSRPRRAALLGGAGLARLAVGAGTDALDLELRGFGDMGTPHFDRLAIRLAIGGRTVLADLDDLPPSVSGWERSTVGHNAVAVDGLNQRETPALSRISTPGSEILFYAADPDFQVATLSDPRAYPRSTTRYRHTVVAVGGNGVRYAVSLFEVHGGWQHDQFFHAPASSSGSWQLALPTTPGPRSLLSNSIPYFPTAPAEGGRWFVQSYGAFTDLAQVAVDRPTQAVLIGPSGPALRLHLLNDVPTVLYKGNAPDPTLFEGGSSEPVRGSLIVRCASDDGEPLRTTFVNVFEPADGRSGLQRVGRLDAPEQAVALVLDTTTGPEYLVVNLTPGKVQRVLLPDGNALRTDGLVTRARSDGLTLAGGTFADHGSVQLRQDRAGGTVRVAVRDPSHGGRGWFETDTPLPDPAALAGRTVLIRHGDGTQRGWTIERVENSRDGRGRLIVQEEPGFRIDPKTGEAVYYQFPGRRIPGPHQFVVGRIARATPAP